jgi:hypothetical protein
MRLRNKELNKKVMSKIREKKRLNDKNDQLTTTN